MKESAVRIRSIVPIIVAAAILGCLPKKIDSSTLESFQLSSTAMVASVRDERRAVVQDALHAVSEGNYDENWRAVDGLAADELIDWAERHRERQRVAAREAEAEAALQQAEAERVAAAQSRREAETAFERAEASRLREASETAAAAQAAVGQVQIRNPRFLPSPTNSAVVVLRAPIDNTSDRTFDGVLVERSTDVGPVGQTQLMFEEPLRPGGRIAYSMSQSAMEELLIEPAGAGTEVPGVFDVVDISVDGHWLLASTRIVEADRIRLEQLEGSGVAVP